MNALDTVAILDLGNDELLDCVDGLELLGLIRRVIGADPGEVMVSLTALGAEGCEARFRE